MRAVSVTVVDAGSGPRCSYDLRVGISCRNGWDLEIQRSSLLSVIFISVSGEGPHVRSEGAGLFAHNAAGTDFCSSCVLSTSEGMLGPV